MIWVLDYVYLCVSPLFPTIMLLLFGVRRTLIKTIPFKGERKTWGWYRVRSVKVCFLTYSTNSCIMRPAWVVSSVGERFPDAEEAAGSIPAPPTTDLKKGAP